MGRPKLPAMIEALADVRAGLSCYAAARKHGLSPSGVESAVKRANAQRSDACEPWFVIERLKRA